jgi:hypothetical protein
MAPALNTQLVASFVEDAIRAKLQKRPPLRPLILAYFVTFRCNLHCAYCDYADQGYARQYLRSRRRRRRRS